MLKLLKRIITSAALITCVAYAIRILLLIWGNQVAPNTVVDNVPFGYELGAIARSIAAGDGFSSPLRIVHTGPTAWLGPIYPYLLAGIFKLFGIYTPKSHYIVEILNCAFASLTVIPIYAMAKKTFGSSVALCASWLWTIYPAALYFPIWWVWDTTLSALLLALLFWATLSIRDSHGPLVWAAYGIFWAVGVLTNPSLLSVFPFLLGWLVWKTPHDLFKRVLRPAVALLAFGIAMLPWTVRNYRVFGHFVPVRSNFGLELWLGNNPAVADTWTPWLHPNDNQLEAEKYARLGESAYMAEKQREAITFMKAHPADTLRLVFHRFVDNWIFLSESPVDTWSHLPWYIKLLIGFNIALAIFGWVGALFASRIQNAAATPYALVLLTFPLVFYLTHSSFRYRFPMDPILIVLAVFGVAHTCALVRGRFRQPHTAPLTASTHPVE